MSRKKKIPGLSFSWKRATGISNVKRKISKATGVPTSRSGRQRKLGKFLTGGGCLVYVIGGALFVLGMIVILM